MIKLIAFFFGSWVYVPYSYIIATVLRFRGVEVGRNFSIQGTPRFRLLGKPGNVVIGDNVTFTGDIDLRNRENGRILIGNKCRIDHDVRIVAAREATFSLGNESEIGIGSVLNCGADVVIGEKTMIAGYVYVQSSNHGIKKGQPIKEQAHVFDPISIGSDVWLASHVSVLSGVSIGDGAVIGAASVVTKSIPANAIAVGAPAQVKSWRTD